MNATPHPTCNGRKLIQTYGTSEENHESEFSDASCHNAIGEHSARSDCSKGFEFDPEFLSGSIAYQSALVSLTLQVALPYVTNKVLDQLELCTLKHAKAIYFAEAYHYELDFDRVLLRAADRPILWEMIRTFHVQATPWAYIYYETLGNKALVTTYLDGIVGSIRDGAVLQAVHAALTLRAAAAQAIISYLKSCLG
jgi:DNA-binding GntR family transcriptional regulator